MYIIHDTEVKLEINNLLEATIAMMPRVNNPRDQAFVKKALAAPSEEAKEEKSATTKSDAMKAMQSLQSNLDAFLDLYGDEEDDDDDDDVSINHKGDREDTTANMEIEDGENDKQPQPSFSSSTTNHSRNEVVDCTPEFKCCMCHSSVCEGPDDTPCMLVHASYNSYPCK